MTTDMMDLAIMYILEVVASKSGEEACRIVDDILHAHSFEYTKQDRQFLIKFTEHLCDPKKK